MLDPQLRNAVGFLHHVQEATCIVVAEHLNRLVRVILTAYPSPAPQPIASPPSAPLEHAAPQTPERSQTSAPGSTRSGRLTRSDPPPGASATGEPSLPVLPAQDQPRQARVEIFCFGTPRVVCGDRQVWPRNGGGDAKPWEFLLYLACQPAEGVSRTAAVHALWSEDDLPDDGAHRFRQLRYRLRRHLQEAPAAPQRDRVCLDRRVLRLDPGLVYSDAQEFLTLTRSVRTHPGADAIERLERARALYVGNLLEGPDTRRYAWVDERDGSGVTLREHFRRLFQNASMQLAELYAASGALDRAVALYRELTDLDPADEHLWQALFRLHAQRGDRRALMAEEQRLRSTLGERAQEVHSAGLPDAGRDDLVQALAGQAPHAA